MGESKQKKARARGRSWATGAITVVANDVECFRWSGTRQEAVDLQKRFLETMNMAGFSASSHADRMVGYLGAFDMPAAGMPDQRPSNFGRPWDQIDVELFKAAILWSNHWVFRPDWRGCQTS
jgi:hypothetical protein